MAVLCQALGILGWNASLSEPTTAQCEWRQDQVLPIHHGQCAAGALWGLSGSPGLLGWGQVQEWRKGIALGMTGHLNRRRKRSFQGQITSVASLSWWPPVSRMLLNLIPRPSVFLGGSCLSIGRDESQNHFKFPKNILLERHCIYGASGRAAVCPVRT